MAFLSLNPMDLMNILVLIFFNECKFYIDRQFGIVQLYVQNESCDNKSIDLFVSHFKSILREIFSALMSMVCLNLFVPRKK